MLLLMLFQVYLLPAAITGIFGITEPAIYGVNLRLKRPMICGCIAGAVGGAVAGGFNALSWSYNMPGIATIPAYFKSGHITEFIGFLISIVVSFVLGMVLTMIVGFKEETEENKVEEVQSNNISNKEIKIGTPAKGHVIPVTEVNDAVFSSEAMGKGVGIKCDDGIVVAPCDCQVVTVFPTKHAIGLQTKDGVELLIHIGIDTVNLEGKGFVAKVSQGQHVKSGDVLVKFDNKVIKDNGYDDTIMFIVTNSDQYKEINLNANCDLELCENVIEIK